MCQWLNAQVKFELNGHNHQADVILQLFKNGTGSQYLQHAMDEYIEAADTQSLQELMHKFTQHGRATSNLFLFWDNDGSDYVQLLLDYIAAKRTDNKDLELETFEEMIAIDFACGHQNYARWGTIAVSEGQLRA